MFAICWKYFGNVWNSRSVCLVYYQFQQCLALCAGLRAFSIDNFMPVINQLELEGKAKAFGASKRKYFTAICSWRNSVYLQGTMRGQSFS